MIKPTPCQRAIYYEITKCISTCVAQTPHMPKITQNVSHNVLTNHYHAPCQQAHNMHTNMSCTKPFNASEATSCISTCIDQTQSIPARTQNASQIVLTWQRRHKMYLSACWLSPSNVGEEIKCISTFVSKIISYQQGSIVTNVFQTHAYQRGLKMHPNSCCHKVHLYKWWSNPFIASEDAKSNSTRDDKYNP